MEVKGKKQVEITDFFSLRKQSISCHDKYKNLDWIHWAHDWYSGVTVNDWFEVVKLMMHKAHDDLKCDMIVMEQMTSSNPMGLAKLNFVDNRGVRHFYVYNWSTGDQRISPEMVQLKMF